MNKCIALTGAAVLYVLTAAAQNWPRYETYLGYTYVRVNSAANIPAFSANGDSGQFVYDFNKWFGGVVDLGAVRNGNIHGLHLVPGGDFFRFTRQQMAFAMTAGGPNDNNQNNLRYSTGFDFTSGGEEPAPPQTITRTCQDGSSVPADTACPKHNLTLSVSAHPQELCPGDVAQVNVSVTGGDRNHLNYQWSINGQNVSQGQSFVFGSVGRQPGTYHVSLSVTGANFNPASAGTTITIREYLPPTGTVKAYPAQVYVGEESDLSATCQGECAGPMKTPTFTASEGSVMGDQFVSRGVQFDPTNNAEQRKTVTITARCSDNKSAGTATTTVTVIRKAVIGAIRLPDVLFSDNNARVNKCGKRILLEELRGYVEKDPTGTVVLVGHSSSDEPADNLDMQRALNTAAVITAARGVCLAIPQSQVLVNATGVNQNGIGFETGRCGISVGTGASGMRRVEVWFIPSGGQPPAYQNASSLPVGVLGCPK